MPNEIADPAAVGEQTRDDYRSGTSRPVLQAAVGEQTRDDYREGLEGDIYRARAAAVGEQTRDDYRAECRKSGE